MRKRWTAANDVVELDRHKWCGNDVQYRSKNWAQNIDGVESYFVQHGQQLSVRLVLQCIISNLFFNKCSFQAPQGSVCVGAKANQLFLITWFISNSNAYPPPPSVNTANDYIYHNNQEMEIVSGLR